MTNNFLTLFENSSKNDHALHESSQLFLFMHNGRAIGIQQKQQ